MHSEALDKQSEESGAQSTESARAEPLARRAQGAKQREERAKDGRHGARSACRRQTRPAPPRYRRPVFSMGASELAIANSRDPRPHKLVEPATPVWAGARTAGAAPSQRMRAQQASARARAPAPAYLPRYACAGMARSPELGLRPRYRGPARGLRRGRAFVGQPAKRRGVSLFFIGSSRKTFTTAKMAAGERLHSIFGRRYI